MKKYLIFLFAVPLLLCAGCSSESSYDSGFDDGYAAAEEEYRYDYEDGYNKGFEDGRDEGFEVGRDVGLADGRDEGFSDGFFYCFEKMFSSMSEKEQKAWAENNIDLLLSDIEFYYSYRYYTEELQPGNP